MKKITLWAEVRLLREMYRNIKNSMMLQRGRRNLHILDGQVICNLCRRVGHDVCQENYEDNQQNDFNDKTNPGNSWAKFDYEERCQKMDIRNIILERDWGNYTTISYLSKGDIKLPQLRNSWKTLNHLGKQVIFQRFLTELWQLVCLVD